MFHHQAFSKAKIKIAFAGIFFCLLFLAGIIGCRKDSTEAAVTQSLPISPQDRSGDVTPTVTHGMLHFDSFEQLSNFTKSLETKEEDSTLVKNAYTALGINVNAETIPNLTDYPICLTTETTIGGYTSARKWEEAIINAALNQGDDNINSIVLFPYWKTAINADRAVHIGKRIYKYYENGGVAIVLNDDWSLYDVIKTQTYESLSRAYNLVLTSEESDDWTNYFILNTDGSINTEKKVFQPKFNSAQTVDGKLAISNISWVESANGTPTFQWVYSDNSSSIGLNPTRTLNPDETLSVTVSDGSGTSQTLNIEDILACSVENFVITNMGNNLYKFGPSFNASSSPYYTKWVFSDGTTSTANPAFKTFTSNGWVRCEAWRVIGNTLACQFTKPIIVKCGDKKTVTGTQQFTQCGQTWKLDGSIWVQAGEVGCKVKYLKKVLGVWVPANNQGACADLSGKYKREILTPYHDCIDVTASGSHCLGNGTYPTSVSHTISDVTSIFSAPSQLSAGLGIKVCGVWRGWGYSGMARLVLN